MSFSPHRLPLSWSCVLLALVGAAYCGLLASPMQVVVPCPGSGCRLFRDFSVFGISLWWGGVLYFVLMTLLCLRRAMRLALWLAGLALALDAALLLIMLASVPCVSCLGVALLMGLLFWMVRKHTYSLHMLRPQISALFLLWAALFMGAGIAAAMEQMDSWVIAGSEHTERRIYFSPSCPACRDAVAVFAQSAAFVPVAERESDYVEIYRMHKALANGADMVSALRGAGSGESLKPYDPAMLFLRFRLLRNKSEVLRLGFESLPLIMVNGMPQSMRPVRESSVRGRRGADAASALPSELLGRVDACGDGPEVCESR